MNKRDVIKHEGMYRNMKSDDLYATGDKVEVVKMEDNLAYVRKV